MGPCLCGDPYCPSCGDPGLADLEAAEEVAMQRFADAKLSPDEYAYAVEAGLHAVALCRKAIKDSQASVPDESY